jgi:FAD/FMN-containing dehydrogenase
MALGDGTMARTGGKVVKNVSGYAVHRLMCGAHGSLGVMLEASIKLMPRADVRRVLIYPCDARDIVDASRWSVFPRLEVAALSVVGRDLARTLHVATPTPSDFVVVLGFEDAPPRVEQQTAQTIAALGEPVARIDGDEVIEMWQALADLEEQPAPRVTFTTATRSPESLAPLIDTGLATGAVFHATAGRLHVHLDPREMPRLLQAMPETAFQCIDYRGVEFVPVTPGEPSLTALRTALRNELDPDHRFTAMGPWAGVSAGSGTTP